MCTLIFKILHGQWPWRIFFLQTLVIIGNIVSYEISDIDLNKGDSKG